VFSTQPRTIVSIPPPAAAPVNPLERPLSYKWNFAAHQGTNLTCVAYRAYGLVDHPVSSPARSAAQDIHEGPAHLDGPGA
jgi:hypothetical protein